MSLQLPSFPSSWRGFWLWLNGSVHAANNWLRSPDDGLVVGLAQVLALIPGVSRSGSTLTASLFDGWKRSDAARFSFLLGVPAITIAGLVELKDAFAATGEAGPLALLIGIVSATIVSWLAIDWLLKFLQRHSTWIFVTYRLLFGVVLLVWWSVYGAH